MEATANNNSFHSFDASPTTTRNCNTTSLRQTLLRLASACVLAALLGGCAATLQKNETSIDLEKESIAVLSMQMTNAYRPEFRTWSLGALISGHTLPFSATASVGTGRGASSTLVTMRLQPGKHTLSGFWGKAGRFPFIGEMFYDVQAEFEVPPRAVVYLGHIDLVNKERTDKDDQASGIAIPLIDQALVGFSGGTLDVKLSDHYERDVGLLKAQYPATKDISVARAPLPSMLLMRRGGSNAAPITVVRTP
ncbi:MAG: hypothetical protein Q7T63_00120 [Burkholderiaceae bacterium]|nr:hypothetical protein [Burkholderiaceae bacterium]MDO9090339.1 hypothetical protein [Burkholderiaceae bacterium]